VALAEKVETFVDPECDRVFPREFPAVLRVHLRNGTVLEERILHNRGGPHNPLSDAELEQKFALNAGQLLSGARVSRLGEAIVGLSDAESVGPLLDLTRAD
jgi:2-methylcitrate dehydratase PrpD